ncbi:uncharacterized protein LOC115918762 [Strongylocentrotus purpuratus]|uniref:Uncharacterized protein n=1 Tax=Strongylocentrotus purpuratus TaxID=7668 RepID=A0A7M7P443_STRPU|nr:uncharacterized protein LOC115918762 [Strongylocentrotus purpuratus]|eukprot:XP_003725722.1 PREDICTED: uncharacterized protein LOC100893999 [Strongylocentrotus purpuratus]
MATSSIAVVVILFVVVCQLGTVHSSGATIIKSPGGWSSVEGSNFTLGCWVSLTNNNMNADTVCRTRIRFTKNSTSIAEGPRHIRSGSTRDVNTNRINCTMTIFRLRLEDSGLYGCCWPDVAGMCSRHPTKMLTVMPALTGAPTTTPESSTTSLDRLRTGSRAPSEHNEVVYRTISMRSSTASSGGENEAYNQKSRSSIHKTIWPLLLVIAVLVILIVLGKRYVKRKSSDGHSSVTSRDPESPDHVSTVLDHSFTYDTDSGVATTTTTTTTTVLNRLQDEDSQR